MNRMTVRELDRRRRRSHALGDRAAARAVPRDRRVRGARVARSTRSTRWTRRSRSSASSYLAEHRAPARRLGAGARVPAVGASCSRSRTCGARRTASDYVIAAKGAPEAIADLCHLDAERRRGARPRRSRRPRPTGMRVLGVARADFSRDDGLPTEQHDFDFEFLGLVRPARPGAPGRRRRGRRVRARRHPRRDDHRRLPGHRAGDRPRDRAGRTRRDASPGPSSTR